MRIWIRALRVAVLLGAVAALPAASAPLSIWLDASYGFDAPSTTAALDAGVATLPDSTFFSNPSEGPPHITITTPSPITGTNVPGATKTNPSTGQSTWTVTAQDGAYQDLWIVIQGHDPDDAFASHYDDNTKIGLVIDPADPRWAIVRPNGYPTIAYLAYFVGDLAMGASFEVPIEYAVAQALAVASTDPLTYMFPRYRVNFLQVPEPGLTALLAVGGALLAIRIRRHAR